jgi:hypothetical protein
MGVNMERSEINEFVEAGITFWNQAEAPNEEDMGILFHGIAFRDHGELEELFDRFRIRTPWNEEPME